MNTPAPKLLCPFCQNAEGVGVERTGADHHAVHCPSCKAHGPQAPTPERAARLWVEGGRDLLALDLSAALRDASTASPKSARARRATLDSVSNALFMLYQAMQEGGRVNARAFVAERLGKGWGGVVEHR